MYWEQKLCVLGVETICTGSRNYVYWEQKLCVLGVETICIGSRNQVYWEQKLFVLGRKTICTRSRNYVYWEWKLYVLVVETMCTVIRNFKYSNGRETSLLLQGLAHFNEAKNPCEFLMQIFDQIQEFFVFKCFGLGGQGEGRWRGGVLDMGC